jgi:hypothetical protein
MNVPSPPEKQGALRTLSMWITKHTAARTLIWLAAFAAPVQGLPPAACECTKVAATNCCDRSPISPGRCPCTGAEVCRCGESSLRHKTSHSRCSEQNAPRGCCHCCCTNDNAGTCPCGAYCHCGKSDAPKAPATPPTESNNSFERIVADVTSAGSFADLSTPDATQQHLDVHSGTAALSVLDRCVVLCRFTI